MPENAPIPSVPTAAVAQAPLTRQEIAPLLSDTQKWLAATGHKLTPEERAPLLKLRLGSVASGLAAFLVTRRVLTAPRGARLLAGLPGTWMVPTFSIALLVSQTATALVARSTLLSMTQLDTPLGGQMRHILVHTIRGENQVWDDATVPALDGKLPPAADGA